MRSEDVPDGPLGHCDGGGLQRRAAIASPVGRLARSFFLEGDAKAGDLQVRAEVIRLHEDGVDGRQRYELRVDVEGAMLGRYTSPPGMACEWVRECAGPELQRRHADLLHGFVPDHLAVEPSIRRTLKARRRWPMVMERNLRYNTTIFDPDDRQVFQDTSFPWSCIGRCQTNLGPFSGVMVGPRHLLTCNHGIDWTPPPGFAADWLTFVPGYFDGGAPFGTTFATHVYAVQPNNNDGFSTGNEGQFDYAVLVLADRIGERTGWWGTKSYNDNWDGNSNWWHIGYPSDIASQERPVFERGFSMNGDDALNDAAQPIYHQADVWPGQSGGPMFGFWDGEPWPCAVAVQSWQSDGTNGASGGASLVDLVIRARSDHP